MPTAMSAITTTAATDAATLQSASASEGYVPAIASPSPPPVEVAVVPLSSTTRTPPASRDVQDGRHYVNRRSHYPRACRAHEPTLEELQKLSFSEYVRRFVLEGARASYEDDVARRNAGDGGNPSPTKEEADEVNTTMMIIPNHEPSSKSRAYVEGMAKVTLPKGFWKEEGIGQDRTGRGPAWQRGTPLGDLVIPNPIKQCIRGIGGIYEYTLLDQPPIALHAFRDLADAYEEQQLSGKRVAEPTKRGKSKNASSRAKRLDHRNESRNEEETKEVEESPEEEEAKEEEGISNKEKVDKEKEPPKQPSIEELERKFWKRLGPTMPPAIYGADMEGTLFGDDPACGWNLGQLDSFLQLLGPSLPGVTSPYLYMGMWATVFAVHTEDMNLLSINYLHAGAPKIWYAIAPGADARRLEALTQHYFAQSHRDCRQFLRHKRSLLSPMILKKAGIKFTVQVQNPGDAMITMPGGYHFGFNTGFNVAEATNFGVPEWIPFGHEARICMCRPDSVRIDMVRLERLLARYIKENKKKTSRRRKSFREWGALQAKAITKSQPDSDSDSESEDESKSGGNASNPSPRAPPKRPKVKEFWVEVMAPVPSHQRADCGRRVGTGSQPRKKANNKKRPRSSKGKQQQHPQPEEEKEVWHLAKPMTRKGLVINAKVLVMIPGSTRDEPESSDSSDSDEGVYKEEEEQCFAGIITEFSEEHCRVHFDRLPKDDDVWIHVDSSKLFLDGGKWEQLQEKQTLPPRHYWQEVDSKRRCV